MAVPGDLSLKIESSVLEDPDDILLNLNMLVDLDAFNDYIGNEFRSTKYVFVLEKTVQMGYKVNENEDPNYTYRDLMIDKVSDLAEKLFDLKDSKGNYKFDIGAIFYDEHIEEGIIHNTKYNDFMDIVKQRSTPSTTANVANFDRVLEAMANYLE